MKKFITAGILMTAACAASAQVTVSPAVLSAIQRATEKNVDIQNNLLEQEKADLQRKSVWNRYIPHLEATSMYTYLNSTVTADIPAHTLPITNYELFAGKQQIDATANFFHAGLTAKTVLFSGGQIYNGAKALTYKNEGNTYMMALQEDAVARDIIESFDQLALLAQAERLIEESAVRLEKEALRVEKAVANGLAVPYDREKIKLAALELSSRQKDLANKKQLLALKLEQATTIPADSILMMPHQANPIILLEKPDGTDRTELRALEAYSKAADYNIRKEKGAYLPTVGAFAGYSYTSLFNTQMNTTLPVSGRNVDLRLNEFTLSPNMMAGVVLKWELFSGLETRHKVEEARLSKAQIDNKLADTRDKIGLQLEKCRITYDNMNDQLAIAEQRSRIAGHNLELADKQYRAGLISVNDRLQAETQSYQEALYLAETTINQRKAAMDALQAAAHLTRFIQTQQ
ncbi:MAG: hypothetical protein BGO09_03185 [Bacteroidetes bacterium 47-18]|nr:MAG: hypothetical protein BGO09_03185 [Bacteroidetes bacterium 47-18]